MEAKKLARVKKGNAPRLAPTDQTARSEKPKRVVEEGMHPSWEAKRKAQEAQEMALANAGKAKKIVF